jgi:DNA-directed RNA polymerase specialized sigma24 family protein
LAVPAGTVKSRLHRGLRELRAELDAHDPKDALR